ncbi:hypothetical protein JCM19379_12070 [Methyloparacoccus murrellii]
MSRDHELEEAANNVTATMRRLIEDLNGEAITPKALRLAAHEFRSLAMYLQEVADVAEARERYAAPVESEGGLL